jgi:hypothetical protein
LDILENPLGPIEGKTRLLPGLPGRGRGLLETGGKGPLEVLHKALHNNPLLLLDSTYNVNFVHYIFDFLEESALGVDVQQVVLCAGIRVTLSFVFPRCEVCVDEELVECGRLLVCLIRINTIPFGWRLVGYKRTTPRMASANISTMLGWRSFVFVLSKKTLEASSMIIRARS